MPAEDEELVPRWRELALHHLPWCRETIASASSHVDMWWSFKELVSTIGTPESPTRVEAESLFNYAWWCVADSGDEGLAVAVETFFYEDLAFHDDLKPHVPVFITPRQFERLEHSFRYMLDDDEFAAFRSRYYAEREKMARVKHGGTADSGPTDNRGATDPEVNDAKE